jgi:flagellar hook-associated protein 1 FlgK
VSDILNIGASGVRAYQSAISTVSENIANSGVEGYSKRSSDLTEVAASNNVLARAATTSGNGVIASGISRSADPLKAADVRSAGADMARSDSAVAWLDQIQSALTGNQLSDRLTSFFTSATAVAADPSASAPRSTMLEAASGVAQAFTATGNALDQVATTLDATAQQSVTTLNSLAAALAKTNDAIGRSTPGSNGAAQLQDQRDQLLEQMSAISDVSVTTDAAGRASVRVGGSGGPVLVSGNDAGMLSYARGSEGAVQFALSRDGTVSSAAISGGALAGIADGAQKLAAAQSQLDQTASSFTDGVNQVQAQGRDLDGTPGAAMFATGDDPTDISVALSDPRGIAAAAPGGGKGDNSNLAGLTSLRSSADPEGAVTGLVATNAAALASRQTVASAQSAIHDSAVAARDGVSGVSIDSEAVDLLRFQQAYSASSRVIQTARDLFQSIIQIQ